jgi:tocopherol cyclase
MRIYQPEVFQGNLKMKNYFEGWYFKNVSFDLSDTYSFIPGISLTDNDSHAFIQILNGITGESHYIRYHINEFTWDRKKFYLKVGNSEFTENSINLKIEDERVKVTGRIDNSNIVKYPISLSSPGIMGWYSFVPFMECKHGIVSVNHDITGKLSINDNLIDFDKGKGYIEKDWGTSFPEAWLWIQANNFSDPNSSFCFSIAKIPWRGKFFIGFIAYLYFNKKFFLFTTYNNSLLTEINHTGESISLTLKNRDSILQINVLKNTFGDLKAPASGNMSRKIKESTDSIVSIKLFDKYMNPLYNDSSRRAGVEVIEKIFEYIKI